jgi:hypothetical protein
MKLAMFCTLLRCGFYVRLKKSSKAIQVLSVEVIGCSIRNYFYYNWLYRGRKFYNFSMTQQPLVGQGLFIVKASRSHSDTAHMVRLLWTSDQPNAKYLPDNTQHSEDAKFHASGGIRTNNSSKRAAANPRLRPRGHWNRRNFYVPLLMFVSANIL